MALDGGGRNGEKAGLGRWGLPLSGYGGRGKGGMMADSRLGSGTGQMVLPFAGKGARVDLGDHLKSLALDMCNWRCLLSRHAK